MPFTEYRRRETSLPARGGYMYVRRGSHRTHGPRVAARMPARSSASTPIEHSLEHLQTNYTQYTALYRAPHHYSARTGRKAEADPDRIQAQPGGGAACTRSAARAEPARTQRIRVRLYELESYYAETALSAMPPGFPDRRGTRRHDATGAAQSPARPRAQHEHQTSEDRDSVVRTSLLSLRIYGCR